MLEDFLARIESLHSLPIDLGLDRIRAVADQCLPEKFTCPVVTVAGTNGKGSTVAVLSALAQAAGLRVATYTSPHLYRFSERIQINNKAIPDDTLLEVLSAVEQARGETTLTFFEYTTLAGLLYFHQQSPDLVILEVGMGGRLDATNIIDPDIAIITSIGLDHTAYLGDTKAAIAVEKAGIMRAGKPVICGEIALQAEIRAQAQNVGAVFYGLGLDFDLNPALQTSLVLSNIACASQAAQLLNLPIDTGVIEQVTVPGRKQHLQVLGKKVLLDVAHNEDSLRELCRYLSTLPYPKIHLVLGMMMDKQPGQALQDLADLCETIHLAAANTPRAMAPDVLIDMIDAPSQSYRSVKAAFAAAMGHCGPDDLVLVTGSFYTVSEIDALNML